MIQISDGMPKKCDFKSLFFFIFFSPGFAPYFRMSVCAFYIKVLAVLNKFRTLSCSFVKNSQFKEILASY